MDDVAIDLQAEQFVRDLADDLTRPRAGECLLCYVARMLTAFDCDTSLRFARHFRDRTAPRATALERRLGEMGGFCDCEIFLNAMTPASHLLGDGGDEGAAVEIPECLGVRKGSTQGCANWVRRRYGPGWC